MAEPLREVLHSVLEACRSRLPDPFYPSVEGARLGIERAQIDAALDHLRLGGFLEIADWKQGKGQGYLLTEPGIQALTRPGLLDRPAAALPAMEQMPSSPAEEIRRAVLTPPTPWVTRLIVGANVAAFIVAGYFAQQQGIDFGRYANGILPRSLPALVPHDFFVRGEWWRLFSYMFLHAGLMHIGFNMFALYSLGSLVESRWGSARFLVLYLGSGILAGCATLLFESNPMQGTVGASGAIAGILTSLGVWAYLHRNFLSAEFVQAHFRAVSTNLLLLVIVSLMPNVSLSAHLGGAIAGAALSFPLAWLGASSPPANKAMGAAALIILAFAMGLALDRVAAPPFAAERDEYQLNLFRRGVVVAENNLQTVYTRDAEPMLRLGLDDLDDRRKAELLLHFHDARGLAEKTATWIASQRGRFPEIKPESIDTVSELFKRRAAFFEEARDVLDNPGAWPREKRATLDRKWPAPLLANP